VGFGNVSSRASDGAAGNFVSLATEQRQGRALGFHALHRLNVQRSTANLQLSNPMAGPGGEHPNSGDRVGVIDLIAHDPKTDEAVLVMNEPAPWDGSEQRLLELQERIQRLRFVFARGEFARVGSEARANARESKFVARICRTSGRSIC